MIRHISRKFDEAAILSVFGKIAFSSEAQLTEEDYSVLAALRRSSDDWKLSIEDTAMRLSTYSEDAISGLVNNVKGILHEMEFQEIENSDGDSVFAALYPDTNHKSVDIEMTDRNSNETWSVQLKATDDVSYINSWIESNENTEILITEELAEKMGLDSSGVSNQEITVRVEDFVDRVKNLYLEEGDSAWEYFPPLLAASIGIVVFEYWRQYRSGKLSKSEFKFLTLSTLGIKSAKYVTIFSLLLVPGLNIVVGSYLLGSLIFGATNALATRGGFKPFKFLAS